MEIREDLKLKYRKLKAREHMHEKKVEIFNDRFRDEWLTNMEVKQVKEKLEAEGRAIKAALLQYPQEAIKPHGIKSHTRDVELSDNDTKGPQLYSPCDSVGSVGGSPSTT